MALSHASAKPPSLVESYAYCADLARSHYENFTVISRFTPPQHRHALEAVYAFCRHTDDLGDEAEGDRLALLDEWEAELTRALTPALSQGEREQEGPTHPIMVALQDTIRRARIPEEPFRKLIEANRMDQGCGRFETYADVLHYCDHSANPVGRMVLHVLGEASEENVRLSDATCTALQLANFWQDVARDYAMGRIYIPLEDMRAFGCGGGADRERSGGQGVPRPDAVRGRPRTGAVRGGAAAGDTAQRARPGWPSRFSVKAACACWTPSANRTTTF